MSARVQLHECFHAFRIIGSPRGGQQQEITEEAQRGFSIDEEARGLGLD